MDDDDDDGGEQDAKTRRRRRDIKREAGGWVEAGQERGSGEPAVSGMDGSEQYKTVDERGPVGSVVGVIQEDWRRAFYFGI
jgi:hypothetical protein